MLLRFAI
jgi:hypothetical protein